MRRGIPILVALALLLAVPAIEGVSLAQGDQARVRAVHAVPGGPPVNVIVNGNQAFSGANYKDVTDYATVTAGTASVQVVPVDNPQAPLFDIQTDLQAGKDYSIVAAGTPDQVEPLVLEDDNSPPPAGQVRVRFVHASPNTPAVDVAQQGGNVLFSNVPFKGVGGYILLNTGAVTLEVREAGTSNVLLTVPNVKLESCAVYTVWAMGLPDEQFPLEAVTSTDAPPQCATPAATAARGAVTAVPAVTKAITQVSKATGTAKPTGATVTRSPSPSKSVTVTKTTTSATKTKTTTVTKTLTKAPTKTVTKTITKAPTKSVTKGTTKIVTKISTKGTVPSGGTVKPLATSQPQGTVQPQVTQQPSQPTAPSQQQPTTSGGGG